MNRKTTLISLAALLLGIGCASAAPKYKALIIDGRNNHAWQRTSPHMKQLLEETGLFSVDTATTAPLGQPLDDFKPDFSKYDVLVCNYAELKKKPGGQIGQWPEETKAAFEQFVKNGGGLVIVHAADNAFPDWKAYNEMIAVGGWGCRNEKDGPMIRWRDGKMVLDHQPGNGGTHGPQAPFQVVNRDTIHPITKGLPETWMHAKDELYAKLRGPAKNVTVLSTAFSKKTGEHEPVLMAIDYGKGRVFHTVLGHDVDPMMKCAGFICTFQRGTEWAASGTVTQPVPTDFPSADQPRVRD